jgi:hypothetical protein
MPADPGLRWAAHANSHSTMTSKGMSSNASWSMALISVASLFCSLSAPLPQWTLLSGLQHLNLVAHPECAAVFYHPRADTPATL